jgi:hypothetical protein
MILNSIQDESVIPKAARLAFEKARSTADIMPNYQLNNVIKK